ncbi:SCO4225 family membrane protein [Streptomyces sp. NPDC055105]|uniref:SCO4225 family membrane protein n=1 Tax=Streptomyces sp. NPDC055105 TaxID=3365719 RepID=UPI0037D38077
MVRQEHGEHHISGGKSMNARTLSRLTFANAASTVYLGLVGASVAFEVTAALFADPGIVGIWPFLLTAPTSLPAAGVVGAVWGAEAPIWYLVSGVIISALIQSFALGALLEALRGRHRGLTRPTRG